MVSSRQKSCEACTKAKRRCNLKSPCLRCTQRQLSCVYARTQQLPTPPAADDGTPLGTSSCSMEIDGVEAQTDFPLDPIFSNGPDTPSHDLYNNVDPNLDTNLADPKYDYSLDPSLDLSLTSQGYTSSQGVSSHHAANPHKLRIEEILRTGADYRRADYHKTTTTWDKFTYETFSDPNSRFSCALNTIKDFHREFATKCQTRWLHPRLYKDGMPENLLSAFTNCVLYANKTTPNEALVYRKIEHDVAELLTPEHVNTVEEHLARVQALLLYQSIRLFDPDVRQRTLAEANMDLFEKWADLLGDLRDVYAEIGVLPDEKPATWESWILAESLRRTVMFSYSLITLHHMLRQENRIQGGWMRGQPWTLSRHLWEAPSSFDFFCAWREKPRYHITCMLLDDFLEKGRGEDVDDFGRSMLVTYMGLDETKQWFKDRGSAY